MAYTPRLREKYNSEIVNNLKGNYKSVMQVPKLVKISLNQGVGKNSSDKKNKERELRLKQQMRNNLLKRKEQKRMKKSLINKK